MRRILLLSNVNENSPSLRYRILFPLKMLNANLTCLSFASFKLDEVFKSSNQYLKVYILFLNSISYLFKILKLKKDYECVIVKNYLVPFAGRKIENFIFKIFKVKKIIYDIDDAIYLNQTREQNTIFSKFRNASAKVEFWTHKADVVFVSNKMIQDDLIKRYEIPQKKFISFLSCPYERQYFLNYREIYKNKQFSEIRFIWLGSEHTQKNLVLFQMFLENISNYIPNAKVIIIGATKNFSYYRDLDYVEFLDWSSEVEYEEMKKAHFGLNPVFNNTFEKRKSAFKVIQYYRAGIIPIASNVGINKELISRYGGYCVEKNEKIEKIFDYIRLILRDYLSYSVHIYIGTNKLSIESNINIIKKELCGKNDNN